MAKYPHSAGSAAQGALLGTLYNRTGKQVHRARHLPVMLLSAQPGVATFSR
jgi:hypothetical protein